tara:strand:+ start:9257 stop:10672 length:1416 start_codon:yes stop_codon:yes gene_type:complete
MDAKKVLAFSIGPISGAVLGLITLPIIAWYFSPEDIGRLTMLTVTISFSLLLFSLGLDQAYVREFHEVKDKPSLLKGVFLPGFILLTFSLVLLLLIPISISKILFDIESSLLSTLIICGILLSFISRFLSLILRMQERGLAFSMSQLLPKLFFLLMILSFLLFNVPSVFENLLIANILSLFAVFIIFVWNTRAEWMSAMKSLIDKSKQKQMINYALPLIGSGLAFWGLTAIDKFFLRSLSSLSELGIYSVAVTFAGVALVFQSIFSTIWVPTVYKWIAEKVDLKKIKNIMDLVALAIILIWSVAGIFSWAVAYILPADYENVQHILLLAIAYPLLYSLAESTGVGIGIERKTMFALLATVVALVVNVICNWFLIPIYGAAGAAMGSAVAFSVFFIIRTEASSRLWISFERHRMYIFIIMLLTLSLFVNIVDLNNFHTVIYGFILVCSVIVYRDQSLQIYQFSQDKIKKIFK